MTKRWRQHSRHGAFAANPQVGGMLATRGTRQNVFDVLATRQEANGVISNNDINEIADQTATCAAGVRGVASFYSLMNLRDGARPSLPVIRICDGPSCVLRGSEALLERCCEVANREFRVERTSCLGCCERAPVAMLDRIADRYVTHVDVESIADRGSLPPTFIPSDVQLLGHPTPNIARRPLTKRFGVVNPRSIESALSAGAYLALTQALETDRGKIVDAVRASGLRGRGGAGFNAAEKWQIVADTESEQRYVICNADESEPGTFKDRMLMENDPHLLLEGMAICGWATGSTKGLIYVRGEYLEATEVLNHAILEARKSGFLGRNVQGSGFDFDVSVHRGAGAYICGEETALIESLEGKRGEPRIRPPFPAQKGYRGMPTVINNVETLCCVPSIIHHGPQLHRDLGRGSATGTKLYCLSGHVENAGLCEAPSGVSLRQIIQEFGGGIRTGSEFKFALTGGAAGTFVPESLLDVPLAHESWNDGVAVGSGAVIVADKSANAAEVLLGLLSFFEHESCGKCTPCRIGTVQAREIVGRIVAGRGESGDLDRLLRLSKTLGATSLCGLGQSVAWPIESAIKHFRTDFEKY